MQSSLAWNYYVQPDLPASISHGLVSEVCATMLSGIPIWAFCNAGVTITIQINNPNQEFT